MSTPKNVQYPANRIMEAIRSMIGKLSLTMMGTSQGVFPHAVAKRVVNDIHEIFLCDYEDAASEKINRLRELIFVAEYLAEVGKKCDGIKAFLIILETIIDVIVQYEESIFGDRVYKNLEFKIAQLEKDIAVYVPAPANVESGSLASNNTGRIASISDLSSKVIQYAEICSDPKFLHGYMSVYEGQQVYVAIWDGTLPASISCDCDQLIWTNVPDYGPTRLHFATADATSMFDRNLSGVRWRHSELMRNFVADNEELGAELSAAEFVIDRNVARLFREHSNLVAVQTEWTGLSVIIRLIVSCKFYIPVDESPLPKTIDLYKTQVRQGWFRPCGLQGMMPQDRLYPGCAVAPEPFSSIGGLQEPTFGTVGGYVTACGISVAVTVGHLFSCHETQNTLGPPVDVVACPPLAQLLVNIIRSGEAESFEVFCAVDGASRAILKMMERLKKTPNELSEFSLPCGQLVGCLHAVPLQNQGYSPKKPVVDVAVFRVDAPVPFMDLDRHYEGLALPSLCVELVGDDLLPANVTLVPTMRGRQAHGYGARSSRDLLLSFTDDAATWTRARAGVEVYYKCFSGTSPGMTSPMQPGDSGTWFWCDDSTLVGMGIGTMNNQSLITPMADVLQAVRELAFPDGAITKVNIAEREEHKKDMSEATDING